MTENIHICDTSQSKLRTPVAAGAQTSPADGIRELAVDELAAVSGGGLWDFVIGYVGGKAIDFVVDHRVELYNASHHYGTNGHNPSPY